MKNHIFDSSSIIGAQTVKIGPFAGILEVRVRFWVVEADKYQNNVISMFRNTKVPLENIMGHWDYIFCSLWRIFVILASKIALKGVSSLINHTSFPCKLYYFSKFHQNHMNGHFLNVKSLIRLPQVIPIDVLWLDYPYWPIVSILRIQILEILMIFCHSPADTATNKKIIWSGVY